MCFSFHASSRVLSFQPNSMQSGVIFLSISFALRLKCLAFYMPYLSVFKGQASNVCGSSKRMRARLNNKSNTIFVVVVVVVEFFLLILTSAVCVRVPLFLLYRSKFNTHFISCHVDFDFSNQIVCENQQQQKKHTFIWIWI